MIQDIYKRIFWYWYRHTGYIKSFGYALPARSRRFKVSRRGARAARPSFAFVFMFRQALRRSPLDSFTFIVLT